MEGGEIFCDSIYNFLKNHWYGAAAPGSPENGMIYLADNGFTYIYFDSVWSKLVGATGDAWSKTIGATGDYADWATMIAVMPDLIAHAVTITIEAGTTLTEVCNIRNKHGITSGAGILVRAERYFPTAGALPTADSATATTLRDAALAAAALGDDYFNGCWIQIVHGTGTDNGFVPITDYTDATGDVHVAGGWPGTRPDATSVYLIVGALIDGESARTTGFTLLNNSVGLTIYGIGIKDTTDRAVRASYLFRLTYFYCGLYNTAAEGVYLSNILYAHLRYSGFVNTGSFGIGINAVAWADIENNGISHNPTYGIYAEFAGFCYIGNNFGDGNGTWGTYLAHGTTAQFAGTECSGTSGTHRHADGEFQDVTVDGIETKPGQPSFLAHNSVTDVDVTGDATPHTCEFNTEIFDQGGDWATPNFTAPVDGRYLLTAEVWVTDAAGSDWGYIKVITSNRDYYGHAKPHSGNQASWKHTAIVDMDADDTAYWVITLYNGAKVVDIMGDPFPRTYCSGALIC